MSEQTHFKIEKEVDDFAEKTKIFSEYFPEGKIEKINMVDVPAEATEYFEFKNRQFLGPKEKAPGFEDFYLVQHENGTKTFIAQQTKTYTKAFLEAGDTERLTFFVDTKNDKFLGCAELRFNIKCQREHLKYFKDKPFIGWIETKRDFKKQGLGARRMYLMNAYSRMLYGLPLYSDTVNSEEMKSLWKTLVKRGVARYFKEGGADRYVMSI